MQTAALHTALCIRAALGVLRNETCTTRQLSYCGTTCAFPGGDYRPGVGANRTAQEQHPFHLHGHHFWLLGQGTGIYNDTVNDSQLNTANPPFRDSFTIFKGGWVVFRFKVSDM